MTFSGFFSKKSYWASLREITEQALGGTDFWQLCIFCPWLLTTHFSPLPALSRSTESVSFISALAPVMKKESKTPGSSHPALSEGALCFQPSYVNGVRELFRCNSGHVIVNCQNIPGLQAVGDRNILSVSLGVYWGNSRILSLLYSFSNGMKPSHHCRDPKVSSQCKM